MKRYDSRDGGREAPILEELEVRQLLSVAISRGGTLFSTGTSGNDTVVLVRDAHKGHRIDVTENGVLSRFSTKDFKRIALAGGGGNDKITIDDSVGVVTARGGITLDGGAGADRLTGGSSGGCSILGGAGNDTIATGSGADYVLAGDGNDAVWGGAGSDQLYGDGGDDQVFGQGGNDTLGGNGEDRLLFMGDNGDPDHLTNYPAAELGTDLLNGGKGNDELLCGTWSDTQHYDGTFDRPQAATLIGGAGSDVLNARGLSANDPLQVLSDQQPNDLVPVAAITNDPPGPEAVHVHAHLNIYIGDKLVALPTGLGNFGSPAIHTHPGEFNLVHFHVTSVQPFYLGAAFLAWGISMDATHIGRYQIGDGHKITMEVQRQGRGPFVRVTSFGDYQIQSTGEANGDRRDVINIRYT